MVWYAHILFHKLRFNSCFDIKNLIMEVVFMVTKSKSKADMYLKLFIASLVLFFVTLLLSACFDWSNNDTTQSFFLVISVCFVFVALISFWLREMALSSKKRGRKSKKRSSRRLFVYVIIGIAFVIFSFVCFLLLLNFYMVDNSSLFFAFTFLTIILIYLTLLYLYGIFRVNK